MNYDNNNRGAIWGNDRKANDSQPDFKGHATIDGVEYWVSAWKRKPDANPNSPALSFSVQPKEQGARSSGARSQARQTAPDDFYDDGGGSIPF